MRAMDVGVKKSQVSRLGPYQLLAKIGEGGMGTVYLAKMEGGLIGFNKLAVVKELRADLVGSSAFVEMFLDEARLAGRLTHPHIVHTYEADEDRGRLYIAMEYLDGQPWSRVRHRLWENRTLPLAVHLRVLADALAGLHYAHELQDFNGQPLDVVHCDMSPHNVFVTYDGQVKVVDFGVARAAHVSRQHSPELFLGKLSYCAPEQARGEELDRRADIFSVGVMLWEALTGRRFAAGSNTTVIRRLRALGEEPSARDVAPAVPRALAAICDRALATDPEERFATAAEFREQLTGYLAQHWKGSADLGALVAEAFADERERVRSLVQQRLEGQGGDEVANLIDPAGQDKQREDTLAADLSRLASVTRLSEAEVADDVGPEDITVPTLTMPSNGPSAASGMDDRTTLRPSGGRSRFKPVLLMGGGLLAAGAAALLLISSGQNPTQGVATPKLAATPTPTAAPAPSKPAHAVALAEPPKAIELVLSASPIEATLYVDDEQLSSNPAVARPAADGQEHRIAAKAPGHEDKELVVVFDRDRVLALELKPLPTAKVEAQRFREARRRNRRARRLRDEQTAEPPADVAREAVESTDQGASPIEFGTRLSKEREKRKIYEEVPF